MKKLDDIMNSTVRQCSFDAFEQKVHAARANGEVDVSELNAYWLEVVKEYYGEEGEVYDKYEDMENLWTYVSHFHRTPFCAMKFI